MVYEIIIYFYNEKKRYLVKCESPQKWINSKFTTDQYIAFESAVITKPWEYIKQRSTT